MAQLHTARRDAAKGDSEFTRPKTSPTLPDILAAFSTAGKLPQSSLDRVQRLHAESGEQLDIILTRLGVVSEADLANAFAATLNIPLITPADFPIDRVLPDQLRPTFLRPARTIPLAETESGLVIAMADPTDDETAQAIAYATGRPVHRRVARAGDIERAFEQFYGTTTPIAENAAATAAPAEQEDLEKPRDLASDTNHRNG